MTATDDIAQRRSNLSPAKLALLKQRLEGKAGRTLQGIRVPRCQRTDPLVLSSAQQRLWFLDQLQPGNPVYNIAAALHLEGKLVVQALKQSLDHIIARHETLRTTFHSENGQPVQRIASALDLHIPRIDLALLSQDACSAEVARLTAEEGLLPFDLQTGPLLRVTLLRLAAEKHILLFTVHHIIADAWSLGTILTRELVASYFAFTRGVAPPLPELPIQYADYAAWQQQQWLERDAQRQDHLTYWKDHLADAQGILDLPTDHLRPAVQSFHGASYRLEFSTHLTEALRRLSQEEGATVFMTLLAALAILLARMSGQSDILIGSPIANRTLPELENLIGFFANTLVLRVDLTGAPGFRELLQRVKQVTTASYAHQDVPFEKVVEEVRPERDLSRSPLFQVMFAHNNTAMQQIELPGLTASVITPPTRVAKFDLALMTEDAGRGLWGYFEYNTDLFEEATIARMASYLLILLDGIIADPGQSVMALPLLSASERKQILYGWNATMRAYPDQVCLHELVEHQVERSPEAIALAFAGEEWNYRKLNGKANQLARYLQDAGVRPGDLVGICLERSFEMVVALLAVLKVGGAYVPLDPAYPAERVAFMLADARVSLVLTQHEAGEKLALQAARMVCLETEAALLEHYSQENLSLELSAESMAYVIYTSGSTGKPKGVQVVQRAVINFLWSMLQQPGMTAQDRLLAVTSLSFDIAALEIFLPLIAGARLELASREIVTDALRLREHVQKTEPTVLQATPATWRMLLEGGWTGQCRLRALCGGEALGRDLADRLLSGCGMLWNMYGPTETTIWSSISHISSGGEAISIGRPIANTQIYLLDQRMEPVPIGVTGEIYLGGDGLAWGYLRQPALTAERFLPDPFSTVPGRRIYWTGDLGRYHADGTIECLGRVDHQMKLRGFRIELGEIEAVLNQYPTVQETVVLARKDNTGDTSLIAYLVAAQEGLVPADLRKFLRNQLPDYMIPAAFVQLPAFPRTPNGKLDRQALPDPEGRSQVAHTYVPPQTPLQEQLARIWSEVLGVAQVGIYDNFFDLGGHSLKAVQTMTRVQQTVGIAVSLRSVFEDPTVAGLAEVIEQVADRPTTDIIQSSARSEQHLENLLDYLEDLPLEEIQTMAWQEAKD